MFVNPNLIEHRNHYLSVARELERQLDQTIIFTTLVGRPEEVLDDDTFNWKILEMGNFHLLDVERSTYVYQEGDHVSFISVMVDVANEWASGVMLTTSTPMDAREWLDKVSQVDIAQYNPHIPGPRLHYLLPGDDYGKIGDH